MHLLNSVSLCIDLIAVRQIFDCFFIKGSVDEDFKDYLKKNYQIDIGLAQLVRQEVLVIFKENIFAVHGSQTPTYKPVLIQKQNEIPYANILQAFESNKHLNLPRLSSGDLFYDLCPSWSIMNFDSE